MYYVLFYLLFINSMKVIPKQFEGCYRQETAGSRLRCAPRVLLLPVKCFISRFIRRYCRRVFSEKEKRAGILASICAMGLIIWFRNNFERSPYVVVGSSLLVGEVYICICIMYTRKYLEMEKLGAPFIHFHFVNLNANSTDSLLKSFGAFDNRILFRLVPVYNCIVYILI